MMENALVPDGNRDKVRVRKKQNIVEFMGWKFLLNF
jgi:hypothetical protein